MPTASLFVRRRSLVACAVSPGRVPATYPNESIMAGPLMLLNNPYSADGGSEWPATAITNWPATTVIQYDPGGGVTTPIKAGLRLYQNGTSQAFKLLGATTYLGISASIQSINGGIIRDITGFWMGPTNVPAFDVTLQLGTSVGVPGEASVTRNAVSVSSQQVTSSVGASTTYPYLQTTTFGAANIPLGFVPFVDTLVRPRFGSYATLASYIKNMSNAWVEDNTTGSDFVWLVTTAISDYEIQLDAVLLDNPQNRNSDLYVKMPFGFAGAASYQDPSYSTDWALGLRQNVNNYYGSLGNSFVPLTLIKESLSGGTGSFYTINDNLSSSTDLPSMLNYVAPNYDLPAPPLSSPTHYKAEVTASLRPFGVPAGLVASSIVVDAQSKVGPFN